MSDPVLPLGEDYRRHPRGGAAHLRRLPRRLLARARSEIGISRSLRRGAHQGRVSRRAHSRALRRIGPAAARGLGHARGDTRRRLQRRRVPCADVHHGHAAAARQSGAEGALPAEDRVGRTAPPGVRRDRAHDRLRHDQPEDAGRAARQRPLRRARPESLDLARAAIGPDAAVGAHHARRGSEAARRGLVRLHRRSQRSARPRHRDPSARRHDQPQHQRDLLRRSRNSRRRTWSARKARASATSSTA